MPEGVAHPAVTAVTAAKAALTNYSKGPPTRSARTDCASAPPPPGFIETLAAERLIDRMASDADTDRDTTR
jgi:hypothetical protein